MYALALLRNWIVLLFSLSGIVKVSDAVGPNLLNDINDIDDYEETMLPTFPTTTTEEPTTTEAPTTPAPPETTIATTTEASEVLASANKKKPKNGSPGSLIRAYLRSKNPFNFPAPMRKRWKEKECVENPPVNPDGNFPVNPNGNINGASNPDPDEGGGFVNAGTFRSLNPQGYPSRFRQRKKPGYPSRSYPGPKYKYPSSDYPSNGYPGKSYPGSGYPSKNYPGSNNPLNGYPGRRNPSKTYPNYPNSVTTAYRRPFNPGYARSLLPKEPPGPPVVDADGTVYRDLHLIKPLKKSLRKEVDESAANIYVSMANDPVVLMQTPCQKAGTCNSITV